MRYVEGLVPLPPVVVEIAPPESPQALRQALVDACSRAVRDAVCTDGAAPGGEPAAVVAMVSWKDASNVHIEIAIRATEQWVARDVVFDDHDPPEERWRAAGLVIGTLASVMEHGVQLPPEGRPVAPPEPPPSPAPPVTASAAPPPPPPPLAEPVPAPAPARPASEEEAGREPGTPAPAPASATPRHGWLHAAAIAGSALDSGPPRVGGEIAGHALVAASGLYASAGLSYSEGAGRVHGVRTSFAEAFAGLLFARKLSATLTTALHAEGTCQGFAPSENDVAADGPKSGQRWIGGLRLGADLIVWAAEPAGVFIGGSGRWNAGVTDVRVGDTVIGSSPAFGYAARAGIVYAL